MDLFDRRLEARKIIRHGLREFEEVAKEVFGAEEIDA